MFQKTLIRCLVFIITFSISLSAQADSALGFFPLHTGDLYQYNYMYSSHPDCGYPSHSSYHTVEILGDTLLPTGFIYKKVSSNLPYDLPVKFMRIDSSTANVYVYYGYDTDNPDTTEYLLDSLNVKEGDSFIQEGWKTVSCIELDTLTFLGIETLVKKFTAYYILGAQYSLAYGFGMIQYITSEEDPCRPLMDNYYTDLVYAKINGEEFGTFVDVKVNQNPDQFSFNLEQNYPNPFNPGTTIRYSLPKESHVTLRIFSIIGEEIIALVNENQAGGMHEAKWNAENYPAGIYFYQLKTNNGYTETKKMMILK